MAAKEIQIEESGMVHNWTYCELLSDILHKYLRRMAKAKKLDRVPFNMLSGKDVFFYRLCVLEGEFAYAEPQIVAYEGRSRIGIGVNWISNQPELRVKIMELLMNRL